MGSECVFALAIRHTTSSFNSKILATAEWSAYVDAIKARGSNSTNAVQVSRIRFQLTTVEGAMY